MPIPTESILSAAERTANYKKESAKQEEEAKAAAEWRAERERKHEEEGRRQQDSLLENLSRTTHSDETIALIHDRIREMREEPASERAPMPMSDAARTRLEAEQAYGRMISERKKAEMDANVALRLKRQQEEAAKQAALTPVVHPNPDQETQFPAAKATLGPKKK